MNIPPSTIAGLFDIRRFTVGVQQAGTLIVNANGDRVYLLFALDQASLGEIFLWPGPTANGTPGIRLQTTQPREWTFAEAGPLVGQDWYGSTIAGGPIDVHVIDVSFKPWRNRECQDIQPEL